MNPQTSFWSLSHSTARTTLLVVTGVLAAVGVTAFTRTFAALLVALLFYLAMSAILQLRSTWQKMAALAVIAFAVLNYGFANYTVGEIPLGHLLVFIAVCFALMRHQQAIGHLAREPVLWALGVLLAMAMFHLAFDLAQYGMYAVRDANFVFEAFFLVAGILWGQQYNGTRSFTRLMALMFVLILLYALTYPVAETLAEISPQSGIFRRTPLLGTYSGIAFFLITGSFFFLLVAPTVMGWPVAIAALTAVFLAAWSFIFQERSMYLGIILALGILLVFSESRRFLRLTGILFVSFAIISTILNMFDVRIEGRIGTLSGDFLVEHFQSIFLQEGTPAVGSAHWRVDLLWDVYRRWSGSWSNILFGEGFGRPLIDFRLPDGTVVRQPHNTHLTVLARLGIIGFAGWVALHCIIVLRLLQTARTSLRAQQRNVHMLSVWLLIFYTIGLLYTSVQPWLEFSYGTIPFFFIAGFALQFCKNASAAHEPPG